MEILRPNKKLWTPGGGIITPKFPMNLTPHRVMMGAAGGVVPATVSFTASAVDTTNLTVYTFSSQAIGTANSTRQVVVGVSSNETVSTVTIGGISATKILEIGGSQRAGLWVADVPTGTTADVVVTFASGGARCAIGVWALYNAASSTDDTGSSTANPLTDTLNIPASGVAIGYAYTFNSPSRTFVWSGITEAFDEDVESTARSSGASDEFTTEQVGLTITATPSGSTSTNSMALASWGPA